MKVTALARTRAFLPLALVLLSVAAHASDIKFQTAYWSYPQYPTAVAGAAAGSTYNYRTIVDPLIAAPTSGYCTTTLNIASGFSNQITCGGPSTNIAYKTTIRFTIPQGATYTIRAGGDWGFGAALVIDGQILQQRWPTTQGATDADMWWAGNFATAPASQYLTGTITLPSNAPHILEVYAMESCCDGAGEIDFSTDEGTTWQPFSNNDGLQSIQITGSPSTTAGGGQSYTFVASAFSDQANFTGFLPDATHPTYYYEYVYPAGVSLTYSATNLPPWASLNTTTGLLNLYTTQDPVYVFETYGTITGTPPANLVGTTYPNITLSVTDGTHTNSLAPFSITITDPSVIISGTPATTVSAGSNYSFTPTASGGDAVLTFSVTGLPSWASFSTSNGTVSGVPPLSVGGTSFPNITISVTDGTNTASLPTFTVSVIQVDQGATGAQGPAGATGATGATGPAGPQGPTGPQGLQGPAGAAGLTGPQGPAGIGFNYRNVWLSTSQYAVDDVVTEAGQTYVALQANTAIDPLVDVTATGGNWAIMAAAGAAGATGAQGLIGLTGATGAAGAQGPIGLTGSTGATGAQGPAGPQGTPGTPGSAGPMGPQGLQGTPGATGAQGPQGATGATGTNGVGFLYRNAWVAATPYSINDVVTEAGQSYVALALNTGIDPANDVAASGGNWAIMAAGGAAGAQGVIGPQGPIGLTGATGSVGGQGPAGPQGSPGVTGATGAAGAQGPAGPAGAKGVTGATGAAGPQGPIGATGAIGPQGPAGAKGATGATGATGTQGPAGPLGATGAQGVAGAKGATGPVGPQGPSGPAGPIGPTGATGATGSLSATSSIFTAVWTNPGAGPAGTTYFLQPDTIRNPSQAKNGSIASSTEENFVVVPAACTVIALNIGANNYLTPGTDTSTVTVYHNSKATTMTCSVTTDGNGSGCSDSTHIFTVHAGDTLSLAYKETNPNPVVKLSSTLICQ